MNLEYFKNLISKIPETPAKKLIFIVSDMRLAMALIMAGFNAICVEGTDPGSVQMKSFKDLIDEQEYLGTCMMEYVYVIALPKSICKDLVAFLHDKAMEYRDAGTLFYKKEYLSKIENIDSLKATVNDYVNRIVGLKDGEINLDYFHRYNEKGKVIGTYDMRIVERIKDTVPFIMIGDTVYLYDHGVYSMDRKGNRLKAIIQGFIYPEIIKSRTVNSIYELLISLPEVQKDYHDINNHPRHWVNFLNGFFDPISKIMIEHDPKFLSINQIPYEFKLDWLENEPEGPVTSNFMDGAIWDSDDQIMLWEYIGYCMTIDTSFQKFLMIKGRGGTGKSVLITMIQTIVGADNCSNISLQDLTQRFYPTGLFGKLLNACADISAKSLSNVDIIKKATGEDLLLLEHKGEDATVFLSYAKLLFSANEVPLNLDEKSNAYYRRLMILTMNVLPTEKDRYLKDKILKETDYIITRAMKALIGLYESGEMAESCASKEAVENLHRTADTVKAFLDAKTCKMTGHIIARAELYKAYLEYCSDEERLPHKKTAFFSQMADKGYFTKRLSSGIYYEGIAYAEDVFHEVEDIELPFN